MLDFHRRVPLCMKCFYPYTMNFDLQMSKGRVDIFVLIIHFLKHQLEPYHVIICLFETINTYGVAMALQVNQTL